MKAIVKVSGKPDKNNSQFSPNIKGKIKFMHPHAMLKAAIAHLLCDKRITDKEVAAQRNNPPKHKGSTLKNCAIFSATKAVTIKENATPASE